MDPLYIGLGVVWAVGLGVYVKVKSLPPSKKKKKLFHNVRSQVQRTKKLNEAHQPAKAKPKIF